MNVPTAESEYIALNGQIMLSEEARVPVDDRGLLYGESVFTTIRCQQGAPVRLERHCERLNASLRSAVVEIAYQVEPAALLENIQELSKRNCCPDSIARFAVTRGSGPGPLPPANARPMTLLTVRAYAPPTTLCLRGISLARSSIRRDPAGELGKHKLGSYFPCLLARREALARNFDEAVISDTNGNLLECACSNLFAVVDGQLLTPGLEQNLLPGITRERVLECAAELGIAVVLDTLTPVLVERATEMFISNCALGLAPVARLEDKVFQPIPGPLTARLLHAFL